MTVSGSQRNTRRPSRSVFAMRAENFFCAVNSIRQRAAN